MKHAVLRLWFALSLLAATTFAALPHASAHQTGKSTFVVHIKPDSREIDTLLTCPAIDVAHAANVDLGEDRALDLGDAQRAWPQLGTYLDKHIDVRNNGAPCEVTEHRLSDRANPSDFYFLKAYRCAEPLGTVTIFNDAMTETEDGYQHLGKIQLGEEVTASVFTALTPTVELTMPQVPGEKAEVSLWNFFVDGIVHIVLGPDHVLFVLLLVLLARRLRELLVTVTAFTLAHSVTLVLSALDVVTIAPEIIEPIIALSIILLAIEVVVDPAERRRAYVATFVLGLVHGFGFSYVLRDDIGLPTDALVPALALFNVGVEVGQLGIVALAYPLRRWARDKPWEHRAVVTVAVLIGLVGLFWLVQRVFF